MNMNEERRNMIDQLLSRYTEGEEAECEQERAELENMSDEDLYYTLEAIRYEADQEAQRDYEADRMEILEERGW